MSRRHRRRGAVPLVSLLARLGWQRDPVGWTISCRDRNGRRARLCVRLDGRGVTVGGWALTPLQVGRLRAALSDATTTYALLNTGKPQPRSCAGAAGHATRAGRQRRDGTGLAA